MIRGGAGTAQWLRSVALKPLLKNLVFGSLLSLSWKMGAPMQRSLLVIAAVAVVMGSSSAAYSASYIFGDPPYRLDFGPDPQVESGCFRWNWQQYQWEDHCPIYVNPKAYIHPRANRAVVRTRG